MTEAETRASKYSGSGVYEFCVDGHLPDRWEAWFEGLSIARTVGGTTILRGPVADQSALHSILLKIRNVNLDLISVNRIAPENQGEG